MLQQPSRHRRLDGARVWQVAIEVNGRRCLLEVVGDTPEQGAIEIHEAKWVKR